MKASYHIFLILRNASELSLICVKGIML